jgi:hypothetical protein
MISIKDINIFIITKNRPGFIKDAINSLILQTVKPDKIIILDNSDNNETKILINKMNSPGLDHFHTSGKFGNYSKAKLLTNRKYVLLFHDDDILNQRYLETVLEVLNHYRNVSLVCSNYESFNDLSFPILQNMKNSHYLFRNRNQFAKHLYLCERVAFASAVYSSEYFKKSVLRYKRFGKFNDWPFLVECVGSGRVILLNDPISIYSRIHDGNDSVTNFNILDVSQVANWDIYFTEYLSGRSKFLKNMYSQRATRFALGKLTTVKDASVDDLEDLFKVNGIRLIKNLDEFNFYDTFFNQVFLPKFSQLNYVENTYFKRSLFAGLKKRLFFEIDIRFQIFQYNRTHFLS